MPCDSTQLALGQRTLLPDDGEVVLVRLQVQGRDRIVTVLRPAATAAGWAEWIEDGHALLPGRRIEV